MTDNLEDEFYDFLPPYQEKVNVATFLLKEILDAKSNFKINLNDIDFSKLELVLSDLKLGADGSYEKPTTESWDSSAVNC